MKKISQREARRLRKRVQELEATRNRELDAWKREYPGGRHCATFTTTPELQGRFWAFQSMQHVLVARYDHGDRQLYVYAIERDA